MNISAFQPNLRPVETPLEQLERQPKLGDAQKIAEVSRQFEAVLLRQILSDATKNMFGSADGEESATKGIYQDMVTNSLAESMSRSGGLGLATVIAKQLQIESNSVPAPESGAPNV
jgi:Rod binding protein